MAVRIVPLTTIEQCRLVAGLDREVWGLADAEDVIPPHVLIVSAKRGGILLGAYDERESMCGFVFSTPGLKNGRLLHWSHMLGVVPSARSAGVGGRLKLAQRDAALQLGIDLIEWTYDPLQAANAHLNFARLGVVVEQYEPNLYGESSSVLHRGTPTDRFIAEWHLSRPHVERRIAAGGRPLVRDASVARAVVVNPSARAGNWLAPGPADLSIDERRVLVEIPTGFTEMQQAAQGLALDWRLGTRAIFQAYFARGYRAVDFFLAQEAARGHYLLAARGSGDGPG